jgi:hypothetical protein
MGTVNLLTLAMAGVYNANPCPNPDSGTNDIGNDGLLLPCFGLPAPRPTWVEPQYRRDSTMIDATNRITGPNEPSGIRGIAWSTELNSWYVSDGNIFKMSADGLTCTKLSTPDFYIPTDDLGTYPTGYHTNSGEAKAPAFIKMPGGETKLLLTYRMDRSTPGNTNGWLMIVDTVTGTNNGQIAINYPPGGGSPVGEFGGLLGLAQNPQTGVVYGLRKTDDHFARELVTIDLTTGNTTLIGVLNEGTFGQAITTLAFAPDILITSVTRNGNNLTFQWTGAAQPTFSLQTTASLQAPVTWTTIASGLSGPTATIAMTNSMGFFKISKP